MAQIGIIGAGSWGTALALLFNKMSHKVILWSFSIEEVNTLNCLRENNRKLPGIHIPNSIYITNDLEEAIIGQEILIMAVPSIAMRTTSKKCSKYINEKQIIINAAKGIESKTLLTMSNVIKEEILCENIAVMSGPTHAEEVAVGIPTTIVIGAKDKQLAKYLQNIFMSDTFRVYISSDVIGIELGGALKNIIALAAGMAAGLGYGDNTKAAIITRGIAEITRLGLAMGGKLETFYGLTGIGDTIVTCTSKYSRNFKAGYYIGTGASCEKALEKVMMTVEGIYTLNSAIELGKRYNVELPICEKMNDIICNGISPNLAVRELMMRDKTSEYETMNWR